MILALDCATRTGWCLMKDGKVVQSGVEDFAKRKAESNGSLFLRFRHWVTQLIDRDDVYLVVYEQAHHRGGAATEICVNLTGRVQEACAQTDTEYEPIHSQTLKKDATGKGMACKAAMIKAAAIILDRPPIDDNEADAVLLAQCAYRKFGIG